MELKTNYQYTYFIHPFIIKNGQYQKYILKMLKDENCKLKIFQKEKDFKMYKYFLPKTREFLFSSFSMGNEKVKQLEKDIMQNKNELDVQIIKGLKEFSKVIYIEKLDLEIELWTEDAFLTSMLVAIFSSILSIGFSRIRVKEKNIAYEIEPVYRNQNSIKFEIFAIFQIKVIHIIDTIYVLNKKKREEKYFI